MGKVLIDVFFTFLICKTEVGVKVKQENACKVSVGPSNGAE